MFYNDVAAPFHLISFGHGSIALQVDAFLNAVSMENSVAASRATLKAKPFQQAGRLVKPDILVLPSG